MKRDEFDYFSARKGRFEINFINVKKGRLIKDDLKFEFLDGKIKIRIERPDSGRKA